MRDQKQQANKKNTDGSIHQAYANTMEEFACVRKKKAVYLRVMYYWIQTENHTKSWVTATRPPPTPIPTPNPPKKRGGNRFTFLLPTLNPFYSFQALIPSANLPSERPAVKHKLKPSD